MFKISAVTFILKPHGVQQMLVIDRYRWQHFTNNYCLLDNLPYYSSKWNAWFAIDFSCWLDLVSVWSTKKWSTSSFLVLILSGRLGTVYYFATSDWCSNVITSPVAAIKPGTKYNQVKLTHSCKSGQLLDLYKLVSMDDIQSFKKQEYAGMRKHWWQ